MSGPFYSPVNVLLSNTIFFTPLSVSILKEINLVNMYQIRSLINILLEFQGVFEAYNSVRHNFFKLLRLDVRSSVSV
jgi:hypothetical protein